MQPARRLFPGGGCPVQAGDDTEEPDKDNCEADMDEPVDEPPTLAEMHAFFDTITNM